MANVFISYAREDATLAESLHHGLVARNHEVFFDQDPIHGIAVGQEWQGVLRERLLWATAMVCVVSPAYIESAWCSRELNTALDRGSRILPVQTEVGVLHPKLKGKQSIVASEDLEEVVSRLDLVLAPFNKRFPNYSLYPGLRSYDSSLSDAFFGRDRESEKLVSSLRTSAENSEPSILLVTGAAGCGKSSLIRASVLPTIEEVPGWHVIGNLIPGPDPLNALSQALRYATRVSSTWTQAEIRQQLSDGESIPELVDRLRSFAGEHSRDNLLIFIDQYEEIISRCTPDDRAEFSSVLNRLTRAGVRFIVALRSDYLDAVLPTAEVGGLQFNMQNLLPLGRDELRRVIQEPARLMGITVDEALVTEAISEVEGADHMLPVLAYALYELTSDLGPGDILLESRYRAVGGVRGALFQQAYRALHETVHDSNIDEDEVLRALLSLATLDPVGNTVQLRALRSDLAPAIIDKFNAFIAQRLVVTESDRDGKVRISLVHEMLLNTWPPLANRVEQAATVLRVRRQIDNAADDWAYHGRTSERLLTSEPLDTALQDARVRVSRALQMRGDWNQEIFAVDQSDFSPRSKEFLRTSIDRDYRRKYLHVIILLILLIFTLLAGIGLQWAISQTS